MLTEAQERGIVEINVHSPLRYSHDLEDDIVAAFGLVRACVVDGPPGDPSGALARVGLAGARLLSDVLRDGMVIGMTWGSTLKAIVEAVQQESFVNARVVQLAGALGAQTEANDSAPLVQQLAERIGGTPVLLNAPLLVESASIAHSLITNRSNHAAIELGKQCDIALVGIGIMQPEWSTLYLGGHISLDELNELRREGAIGDACGHPFDANGKPVEANWSERLVGVSRSDLLATPVRIGFATGIAKVNPLYGALRGGYLTHVITDTAAASDIVRLADWSASGRAEEATQLVYLGSKDL
jgi:deoxyribonucleoside regulator